MSKRLSVAALGLWGLTAIGGGAWWVYQPDTPEPTAVMGPKDTREPISVSPKERAVIARVMRRNLRTIGDILQAAEQGEMAAVSSFAKGAGQAPGPGRKLPKLRKNLPPEWREMGKTVHTTLRTLGENADNGLTPEQVPGVIADLVGTCVSCHETYRLVDEVVTP